MSLGIDPGDNESAARYLASLKSELVDEKAARKEDKDELQTLARACDNLKKTADKFAAQVTKLEQKVMDVLSELCAKEMSLERTTKTNEDYKSQNARLTKKLDSKRLIPFATCLVFYLYIYTYIYTTNPDSNHRI
jgi:predicted  nucleic acid-binding Zn-ribbon protein